MTDIPSPPGDPAGAPAPDPGTPPASTAPASTAPASTAPASTPPAYPPQPAYGQPPYGQSHGQSPYGQPSYGQSPYGQPAFGAQPAPSRRGGFVVHIVWELVLLVGAIGVLAAVLLGSPHPPAGLFLDSAAPTGLIAVAVAASLRTGNVNLAAGALAGMSGAIMASLLNHGSATAVGLAVGALAAGAVGAVLGVVTGALSVPSWAVTLGGATAIGAVLLAVDDGRIVPVHPDAFPKAVMFGVFALLTLGGGALFLIPGVRDALSAGRTVPIGRFGGFKALLGAVVGLGVSGLLAGLAGGALVLRLYASPGAGYGSTLTVAGLAIALLGGVSVFGRRAGITGVLFATIILAGAQQLLAIHGVSSWVNQLLIAVALLIGLVVSRVVESAAGPVNAET